MAVRENPTVDSLAQVIDDHLQSCGVQSADTNRRLGRIEAVLIGVAGAAILQLLALSTFLFVKAYG